MIERLLAMLVADLGDPTAIEQLNDNSWKIYLEDELDIEIGYENSLITLSSYVGPLQKNRSFLLEALAGNCLGIGTFGSAICSETGEDIYIKREEKDSISYRNFFSKLQELATATSFWRKQLKFA